MAQAPSIPKGTRDFLPEETARRNYIFETIRDVFHLYGFQQIETPAMENLSTLLGKYGDEGDKLLFRILNSGDFLAGVPGDQLESHDSALVQRLIADKGLRYDLTVPFARFIVQYRHKLVFPFRRYQIQPVWRADRPQKGRYREFYQCDCDMIGSDSLLNEAELAGIIDEVFTRLGISKVVKLNNRKVLAGIAEVIGCPERITDITMAIDKIEKIGLEKVKSELRETGIPEEAINRLEPILLLTGESSSKIARLKEILSASVTGLKGIAELEKLFEYLRNWGLEHTAELDLTLARGLDYYTGAIIEVKAVGVDIGSICGGGRYDDLTGIFGLPGVSGVGISFGADRIYDVLTHLNQFPAKTGAASHLFFVNFGETAEPMLMSILAQVRKRGLNAEIYPDHDKVKKQLNYAHRKGIPWVVLAGDTELSQGKVTLKNMISGEQFLVTHEEMINTVSKSIKNNQQ